VHFEVELTCTPSKKKIRRIINTNRHNALCLFIPCVRTRTFMLATTDRANCSTALSSDIKLLGAIDTPPLSAGGDTATAPPPATARAAADEAEEGEAALLTPAFAAEAIARLMLCAREEEALVGAVEEVVGEVKV
jgi:hypothetical protein